MKYCMVLGEELGAHHRSHYPLLNLLSSPTMLDQFNDVPSRGRLKAEPDHICIDIGASFVARIAE